MQGAHPIPGSRSRWSRALRGLRRRQIHTQCRSRTAVGSKLGDVRGVSVSEDGVDANVEFVEHVVFESGDGLDYSFGGLRLERVFQHVLGLYVLQCENAGVAAALGDGWSWLPVHADVAVGDDDASGGL